MKNNVNILILLTLTIVFQACGELPVQGGFTEETIDTSNTSLTPGIQEGICEETDQGFVFKSNDGKGNGVTFSAGTGIWVGPNGELYKKAPQTKSAEEPLLHEPHECIMEVSEDGSILEFTPKSKTSNITVKFTRGHG